MPTHVDLTAPQVLQEALAMRKRLRTEGIDEKAINARIKRWVERNTREYLKRHPRKVKVEKFPGFVYLARRVDGLYKIGCTNNPKRRLQQIRTQHKKHFGPSCIEMIHTIESNDMYSAEIELHRKFSDKSISMAIREQRSAKAVCEWFTLDDEDVAYIKSLDRLDRDNRKHPPIKLP